LLRSAYSGELAAGHAYRGHGRSLKAPEERSAILRIEREEWAHREVVGAQLRALGAAPNRLLDGLMLAVGIGVGLTCFVSGHFIPMYFAGRLESGNIQEYVSAAGFAKELGRDDFAAQLLHLADVESEHERFFRDAVAGHRWLPMFAKVFGWGARRSGA
jgi:demethoxyubiquinone hydroxylase (CLK1/Coq7/Cat5 family)